MLIDSEWTDEEVTEEEEEAENEMYLDYVDSVVDENLGK